MEPWQRLDGLGEAEARATLTSCCGSSRWVDRMLTRRPFSSQASLLAAARDEWFGLGEADWREAFAHHPRIGDRASLQTRFPETRDLSLREQRGVDSAGADVLTALEKGNRRYEATFGHIFIICATGKTAAEMLDRLKARLGNDAATEIRVAAAEQAEITALRLNGLA